MVASETEPGPPGAGRALSTLAIAILTIAVVGGIDHQTGTELRLYPLYFPSVALVAWRLGRWPGVAISALAVATWVASNHLAGLRLHPLIWFFNASAQMTSFTIIVVLIDRLHRSQEVERRLARVDSLTGLPNPRAFAEAATAELDRQRRSGRPLTIAFLDLDRFKEVNDRHGHQAGDALLAEVARCLRSSTRATDHLGRLGGDEFAVLMPETDEVGAERVLERIQASILNAMGEQGWPVTSSIGAVVFPVAPASVDELVGKADQLMYLVKHSGKGAFRIERIDGPPATR